MDANDRAQISRIFPAALILLSIFLLLFRSSPVFLLCALLSSVIALRSLYILVFHVTQLRFTWMLATGLLLGYGLGSFSTAFIAFQNGWTVSRIVGRDQAALCIALAVCLAVSALLYWIGLLIEPPIRLNWIALEGSGPIIIWTCLAVVIAGYLSGGIGYMGTDHDAGGYQSAVGIMASMVIPVLPGYTFLVFVRKRLLETSPLIWILLACEFGASLPQGRRVMIYSVVTFFLAVTLRGHRLNLKNFPNILMLIATVVALYFGNKIFYAMRYERMQAGRGANIALTENLKSAVNTVTSGDSRFSAQLGKNLSTRTFVLTYFSDLLDASWTHRLLWGKTLIYNIRFAIPSALDPNKADVLAIPTEETLVNPEFGLKVGDEANSILTTGVADFGIVGCFLYPVIFTLVLSRFFRASAKVIPPSIAVFAFLRFSFILFQTEVSTTGYVNEVRNVVLASICFYVLHKINAMFRKPGGTASRPALNPRLARTVRLGSFIALLLLVNRSSPGQQGNATLSLKTYDSACGQPRHNCRAAFQQALSAIRQRSGGTLTLPAGTFQIDFPEIPNNSRNAPPLTASSLILIPPNTTLIGHLDGSGKPDTIIEWSNSSVPLFVMPGSSHSVIEDLHLRFTGSTPHLFPYGDSSILKALGYQIVAARNNLMGGGNYELFSVFYMFDSEYCKFDNLVFDSKVRDNDHVFGNAFMVKGKTVFVDPTGAGGGLTNPAAGNVFSNLAFYDDLMGMTVSGQQDLQVNNITADRRGSTMDSAPGHVIYLTHDMRYTARTGPPEDLFNKQVTISNLTEGALTYSNIHSGGTLAVKFVDGGTISHIVSHHPVGLIQALYFVKDLNFQNLDWETDYNLCESAPPDVCLGAVINAVLRDKSKPSEISNINFDNIFLKSTVEPISVMLIGDRITIKDLTIACPPDFKKYEVNPIGVLNLKNVKDVSLTGFHYDPIIKEVDTAKKYNSPLVCFSPCQNVNGDMKIEWPKSVPLPKDNERIVSPSFGGQEKDPSTQIHIAKTVVLRDKDPEKSDFR